MHVLIDFFGVLEGLVFFFFFSSRRRHTRCSRDWSSDVCSSDRFEYLTALQRNAASVCERPGDWMPWNYRATLAGTQASRSAGNDPREDPTTGEKVALRSTG